MRKVPLVEKEKSAPGRKWEKWSPWEKRGKVEPLGEKGERREGKVNVPIQALEFVLGGMGSVKFCAGIIAPVVLAFMAYISP